MGFKLKRLGQIMEPEPGNPMEMEGVLNPATARGPDGELYLFPRLVAKGKVIATIGLASSIKDIFYQMINEGEVETLTRMYE